MKSIVCSAVVLSTCLYAHAEPEACRVAPLRGGKASDITWTGACKDGWADGLGVLEKKGKRQHGWRYEGAVLRGLPHGHGYMLIGDGTQFEGEYIDGKLDGPGIYVDSSGDRYDGGFKNGRSEGRGSMSYALGGRYDGEWKDGVYHGIGLVEYPGGRKLQIRFENGVPVGKESAAPADASYKLKAAPSTGSMLPQTVAVSPIPINKPYALMDDSERASVKRMYPLMDDADEPPFPLKGMREIDEGLSAIAGKLWSKGYLDIIVQVDSEGNATTAQVIAAPDPELGKTAAQLFLFIKYKPAMCAGTPCAMAFPYYTNYVTRIF